MVAKKPEDRFQSMAEVEAALGELLSKPAAGSAAATPAASGKFSNSWKSFTGKANPSQPSAAGVATLARPDAATNPTTGDMATVALASPLQGTDPVSQRSVQIVRDLAPQPASAKRRPLWRQPRVLAAGAAGAIFLVLLGIWVIIRDKNGNEVARMKVPDGGRTEVVEGEVAPQKTDAPASPSVGAKAHTGQFGLQFDRDKKCLVTTEPLPHPTALPRTFEVWCKVDAAYEHAPGYLLRNYPWGALNVNGTYAGIKGFSFYTYHGEANTPVTPYPMGQRIHLAGVNDGRKRLLFLNGKLIAESADAGGLVTDAKDPLPIELGQNFTGELYAARLSSVARYTQDFEPPLEFKLDKDTELLFNFSEGQGDILRDSSGHNRHGKIVGAKWVRVGEVANAPATGNSQNKSALSPYEIFSSPDYEWTTPENLGPVVNSEDGEGTPFLAANGLTLYFDSGRPGGAGSNDLWFCRRLSLTAPWGAPENVGAPINTDTKEMGPSLSANELTLVFAREKTRNSGKFELWQATRDSLTSPWQTPVQLQSLGSAGAGFDDDPELSADGLTLLFHSNRNKGNREDLFFSRRASRGEPWPAAQNLGPVVNSWFREMSPALSSDGLVLVFSSDRDGGVGRTDLWFSLRTSSTAEWSEPRHLGRIANSAADDLCPALSADGQTLYFRSNRPGVLGKNNSPDLWMSRRVKKGTSKSTDGFTNTLGMEFVRVPKGKTWLGGGGGKAGTREVEFKEDYYLGKFEVTQDEWQRVRGKRSSSHFQRLGPGGDLIKDYSDADVQRLPVEMVNWNEAQEFIRLLNQKSPEAGWQYRLPTADEWEYACRGGPLAKKEDSAFHYYLAQPTDTLTKTLANISEGVPERTCPVGRYPANSLGLHDMHGNVYEWCDDKLLDKPETASRFAAGGSFANAGTTEFHRASYRAPNTPSRRSNNFGFRVARVRAETQTAWQSLFNGKDLTGWNKTNPKDTGTAEVVVEDGQPALQISGPYGIHSTVKTRDFHLRFDFKAEKETRGGVNFFAGAGMGIQARLDTLTRSTPALAFHVWGITCQESELRNGKFNPVGQTVGKDAYLDFTKFNLNTKSTWQRIEVVRLGDSMLFLVNGQVAGAVTNLRDAREPEAKAVDYSPIAIWSDLNGSAQFRKIEIREITTLPPGLFDQGTVR
jgi:formylglycine-generating enzyme required for sulfatase activity